MYGQILTPSYPYRFTNYDFRKMHRRSYYPQNQQIVSQVTATSSIGMVPSRSVTPLQMDMHNTGETMIGMTGIHGGSSSAKSAHDEGYSSYGMNNNISEKER